MGSDILQQWRMDAARKKGAREAAKEAEAAEKEAKVEMANALIAREMPDNLRERARSWGVEAIMDAVWLNAYGRGYVAGRDDAKLHK